MPRLFFKKRFHAAIRQGRKTTTLRRWKKERILPGDKVFSPGVGWLVAEAVEAVCWQSLTDNDAVADGFESLADMGRAVARLYPRLSSDGKSWFRVKFIVVEITDPSVPSAIKPARKKSKKTRKSKTVAPSRERLAQAVRAELDKAVRGKGS